MRCASRLRAALLCLGAALLAACGGGSSTETTCSAPQGQSCFSAERVDLAAPPAGPNTTAVVVDAGPGSGFSFGAANIPYVTVTVCEPGSTTACVTVDHVILDTGSYGLRVLKSRVPTLALPPVTVPATASSPAGAVVECYPFVIGGLWGPVAQADVRVAGELAPQIPIQVVDDRATPALAPTADCKEAAQNQLLASAAELQANGVLGVGPVALDCGLPCARGDYTGVHTMYYACPDQDPAHCAAAPVPSSLQLQNPVAHFADNNNGTLIVMPAVPLLGAVTAEGRLVFGIGTQTNNQPPDPAVQPWIYLNTTDPHYLGLTATLGAQVFPDSQIDTGSNAYFFDDTSGIPACAGSTWFCPPKVVTRSLVLSDALGHSSSHSLSLVDAQSLFGAASPSGAAATAFQNLGGSVGNSPQSLVLGMPHFYGRGVYTAIWGQALAKGGPWIATTTP